jgi:ribosomal-protein-alanine N-acetyltransferase
VPAWRIEPASDEFFEERARWRYEPPYDFYDDDGEPVLNPERFYAVRCDDGIVGFFYVELRDEKVFYGLGMRPDLTGRGLGLEFVRLGLDFVHEQFPGRLVILDVAEFNVRADGLRTVGLPRDRAKGTTGLRARRRAVRRYGRALS